MKNQCKMQKEKCKTEQFFSFRPGIFYKNPDKQKKENYE